jgi:hypothetical protein
LPDDLALVEVRLLERDERVTVDRAEGEAVEEGLGNHKCERKFGSHSVATGIPYVSVPHRRPSLSDPS